MAVAYVVDGGLAIITNCLIGSGTNPKFIGWGTNATEATSIDTGLGTVYGTRVEGTSTRVTSSTNYDTYQVSGTLTATSTQTVTEVALFDALTDGNCFLHGTFTGIALNSGDAIAFVIKATFNQA